MITVCTSTKNVSSPLLLQKIQNYFGHCASLCYYEFPEFANNQHPQELFDFIYNEIKVKIDNDSDIFIVTWSDIVLYAIRVAIAESNKETEVHCFQFDTDKMIIADILRNGQMTEWMPGCFDTVDKANLKLL